MVVSLRSQELMVAFEGHKNWERTHRDPTTRKANNRKPSIAMMPRCRVPTHRARGAWLQKRSASTRRRHTHAPPQSSATAIPLHPQLQTNQHHEPEGVQLDQLWHEENEGGRSRRLWRAAGESRRSRGGRYRQGEQQGRALIDSGEQGWDWAFVHVRACMRVCVRACAWCPGVWKAVMQRTANCNSARGWVREGL